LLFLKKGNASYPNKTAIPFLVELWHTLIAKKMASLPYTCANNHDYNLLDECITCGTPAPIAKDFGFPLVFPSRIQDMRNSLLHQTHAALLMAEETYESIIDAADGILANDDDVMDEGWPLDAEKWQKIQQIQTSATNALEQLYKVNEYVADFNSDQRSRILKESKALSILPTCLLEIIADYAYDPVHGDDTQKGYLDKGV
jgi:hypothetical protein